MAKKTDIQGQEAQRVPNKLDPKRTTQKHIIIKMPKGKNKERILKAARESTVTYKGVPIRLPADFSKKKKNCAYKKGLGKIFKVMKSRAYNLD